MRSEERRGRGRETDGKEEGGKNAERGGEIERIHDVGHLKKREGEGEEERCRRGRREGERREREKEERGGEGGVASYSGHARRGIVSSYVVLYRWFIQYIKEDLQPFLTTYGRWLLSVELSTEDWGSFKVW